jgi:hypothetical protein
MENDPRTEPLREWNRIARENAENAIVSSMFEAAFKASEPIETFSTWLLVGTAAVASFFITNADKLLPFIGGRGFLICGAFLSCAGLFGLLSRLYALRCKIQIEAGAAVRKSLAEHLTKNKEEEAKISDGAKTWGIRLETGIRIDRLLREFLSPLPRWVRWLVNRSLKKDVGNPQIGYLPVVRGMQKHGLFAILQALSFFGFVVVGFLVAAGV